MFDDIMRAMLYAKAGEQEEETFSSRTEACEALQKFVNAEKTSIKVGDYIERNELGQKRYRLPQNNQAAMCTAILPEAKISDDGSLNDMQIAVAVAPERFLQFLVDSRFYRVAGSKSNVTQFGRRLN